MSNIFCAEARDLCPDAGECNDPGIEDDLESAQSRPRRSEHAIRGDSVLEEVTAGIVHDFRNILAVIDSGLSLAERHPEDPDKARVCLAAAREGVGRGLALTTRLLSFVKQHDVDSQAVDVNDLLRSLELFVRYGAGPGIRIAFDLAPDISRCRVDPVQFNAAILNLVVNARDAMPDGGKVTISTEACEIGLPSSGAPASRAHVRVRVSDNGQGMPPDVARKIFDPCFTTKGETGTGQGLPQVCAFMRQVGGRVSVTSEPGLGTSFDLVFPVQNRLSGAESSLGRQVDRWVNEGGAEGGEMSSFVPPEPVIGNHEKG